MEDAGRGAYSMISRVAEHCFWMSRYLERAENIARVLEVNQTLLLDYHVPLDQQWRPLLIISGIHHLPADVDGETVQRYLTWESDNLSSIARCLQAARENARTPVDNAHWVAILTSCSGYEPYHKQRVAAEPNTSVPDFLIFDPIFPRSVRHSLTKCQEAAHAISGRPTTQPSNEVEQAINALAGWLQLSRIEDFIRAGLHEMLTVVI